jgi:hypothetical protein
MPKPGPLIKTVSLQEGLELPYLGGGMRVSKSNFGPRRNQNHFRITNSASNTGKLPNLKVGFSANFDDVFGLIVDNVHTTIHSHDTEITVEFDVTDILVTSEAFVEDLVSYSIILPLNDDGEPIIQLQNGADTVLEIDNPVHQQFLIRNGTETTIETVGTVGDRSFDFASFDRSVVGTTNPEVVIVDDTQYATNAVNQNIDTKFGRKQRVKVTPSSTVVSFESGLKKTTPLYGPDEFATIVLIDDGNNKGADRSETRIKIKNKTRVEGVELKSVAKTAVTDQPSNVINDSSELTFTFELSNNQVIHKDDITRICLLRENVFDETHVVANIDTSILDSAVVTTVGHVETHTIQFQPNVDGGYQGPVYGFVQMKDVTWSPKSIFDPGLVYDITNEGAYDVEYVSTTPYMITMKLTQFDHATNIPHTVRINAKIGDQVKSNVEFSGITPTNYQYTANLENLTPTTTYDITLTVDDGINPMYEQPFGTFKTSTDDNQGPDIQFIHLTGHGDHVYLHANIVDNKSPIREIKTMLMTQSGYKNFFTIDMLKYHGLSYSIPSESSESLYVEIREELGNVITNDQGAPGSFKVGEEYTVIVRAVDDSASENANIAVQTVTLYEPIRFGHVGFVDGSGSFEVTVPIDFASAAVSNVDVYCGVFASDPGFTTANVEYGLQGWQSVLNVSGSPSPKFTFAAETDTLNAIVDLNQYYVVVYARSVVPDLAYAPYANIHTTTYTKLDKAGPVFNNVNVNFDNFA